MAVTVLSTKAVAETMEGTKQEVRAEDQGKQRRDPWYTATFRALTEEVGPVKDTEKENFEK